MDTRRRRGLSVVALALLAAWLLPATAISAVPAASSQAAAAAPSRGEVPTEDGKLVLVLDSSGSMKQPADGGRPKIQVAKQALDEVIDELPAEADVGLRVYGADVFSRSNPASCTDSQLVVPVGSDNRGELRRAVQRYEPYGETPIGYALQQAAKDLGDSGKRSIVLVSDGEPTCPPPPCEVAADIVKSGVELKIDVVGLDVDGKAREILQCIATKGGGTYYDADSADDLTASLTRLATRAFRPFAFTGTPVTGTEGPADAPAVEPGAQYLDTVGVKEQPKHYRVPRTIPGSTLHVAVTARPGIGLGQLSVTLQTPDGEECASQSGLTASLDTTHGLISTAVSSVPEIIASRRGPCAEAESLLLQVQQEAIGEDIAGTPVELVVFEEPPVADVESLPGPAETPRTPEPWQPASTPEEAVPGTAFTDAPPLEPGTYEGSLLPGEIQFFEVPVAWGQQLQAQLQIPSPGEKLADAIGPVHPIDVKLYSPSRVDVTSDVVSTNVNLDAPTTAVATTAEVRYRNRENLDNAVPIRAGSHYVAISFDPAKAFGSDSFLLPYRLSFRTVGEALPGPEYVEEPVEPTPTEQPSEPSDEETDPGTGANTGGDDAAAPPADGAGMGLAAGLGIAAVALAALAVGFLVVRRRSGR